MRFRLEVKFQPSLPVSGFETRNCGCWYTTTSSPSLTSRRTKKFGRAEKIGAGTRSASSMLVLFRERLNQLMTRP